jgi:hypothetical protein
LRSQYAVVFDGILGRQNRPFHDVLAGFNIQPIRALNDLLDKGKTSIYDADMDASTPSFSPLKKDC